MQSEGSHLVLYKYITEPSIDEVETCYIYMGASMTQVLYCDERMGILYPYCDERRGIV